ncbi:MAG: hypothetical protein EP344_17065 [Bacteroidetes bacterium]|nr:MAG: hypothetical protein EP344_17065 [Bacteroidota bacterium]
MIRELNDLLHYLKTSTWRADAIVAFLTKEDPALLQLYRTIWAQPLHTDTAAARAAGVGLTTYKKQARQLRLVLQRMLVFFNAEKARADVAVKNHLEGIIEGALLQLLEARGYLHAPGALARRLHRRGRDYDRPAVVVEALRIQQTLALQADDGGRWYDACRAEYLQYRHYLDLEESATVHWQGLQRSARLPLAEHRIRLQQTMCWLEEVAPLAGQVPSVLFHLYYYLARGYCQLESGMPTAALANFDAAVSWFENRPYPAYEALTECHGYRVLACLLLNQYADGEVSALASLDHTENGAAPFFRAYERYFYLAVHTDHAAQALDILHTVFLHRRFSGLPPELREQWQVLGAYLFILYRLRGQEWPVDLLPVYRSGRFANQTAGLSRDKTGMNVAVQIAITLLLLLEEREDDMLERLSALARYRSRYLRLPGAERSGLMIRLLSRLPRVHFRKRLFLEEAQPVLQEMARYSRQLTHQHRELEVVPFGMLVEAIGQFLGR